MILVAAVLVAAASVALCGGHLSNLARMRLEAVWSVAAALALQVLIISVIPGEVGGWRGPALQLASYVLGAIFLVANRRVPWLWLIGLGGALNLIAISSNGGVMPASAEALRRAGRVAHTAHFMNSRHLVHPKVAFLGDIFATPRHWPLANVFSVGDILLAVGAFLLLHTVGASKPVTAVRRMAGSWSPVGTDVPGATAVGPAGAE